MRLDLKDIIHVPGAKESFSCEMDLSNLDFYGTYPICEPVTVRFATVRECWNWRPLSPVTFTCTVTAAGSLMSG